MVVCLFTTKETQNMRSSLRRALNETSKLIIWSIYHNTMSIDVCLGTFVLVHWVNEDSTTVVPAADVKAANGVEVGKECSVERYLNCPAKVAGIGKFSSENL